MNSFLVEIGAETGVGAGIGVQKKAGVLAWLGVVVLLLSMVEVVPGRPCVVPFASPECFFGMSAELVAARRFLQGLHQGL